MSRPQENPGRAIRKQRQRRKKIRAKNRRYSKDEWKTDIDRVTGEVRR